MVDVTPITVKGAADSLADTAPGASCSPVLDLHAHLSDSDPLLNGAGGLANACAQMLMPEVADSASLSCMSEDNDYEADAAFLHRLYKCAPADFDLSLERWIL